jgi:dTDP-4-amino-4,6-dideoxygalactose transaminase
VIGGMGLAVFGGEPVVDGRAIRPWPEIHADDKAAVMEVLETEDLSFHRQHQSEALAREWNEYLGSTYCVPTNSGTSALHMAVASLGVKPGDEVIVPAFTFWASAAAVLHHNAVPVFVDIDPQTLCLDPRRLEEAITPRTRAVMPVHIHGTPAAMDEICAIASRHGLRVIEDCAQAHGSTYHGRLCGRWGDVAGFSVQATKVLTTGSEGGLFVTDDEDLYRAAALLGYFGEMVAPGRERAEQEYNAVGLGWMYRGDVLGQALVRSRLRRLDVDNAARIANCEFLTEGLASTAGLQTPFIPPNATSVYYNYVVGVDPAALGLAIEPRTLRDRIQNALRAEGVPVGLWQRLSVPAQDIFQNKTGYGNGCPWTCKAGREITYDPDDYPVTNEFLDRYFYVFDVHPPNDTELMELYLAAFRKVMAEVDQLPDPDQDADDKWLATRREMRVRSPLASSA